MAFLPIARIIHHTCMFTGEHVASNMAKQAVSSVQALITAMEVRVVVKKIPTCGSFTITEMNSFLCRL